MSIAETVMQERSANAVQTIERMLAQAETFESDFARGQASGLTHALEVVRNSLRPYLVVPPCGCGNPSIGQDITGAPICAHCQALAVQALEQIPTQRSDR